LQAFNEFQVAVSFLLPFPEDTASGPRILNKSHQACWCSPLCLVHV